MGELREGDFDALVRVLKSDDYLGLMERLSVLDPEGALGFDLLASQVRLAVSDEAARSRAESWLRRAAPRDPRVLDAIRTYAGEPTPVGFGPVGPVPVGPAVRNTVSDSAAGNIVQAHTVEQVNFYVAPPDPALWLDAATVDPHALGAPHEGPYIRRDRDADLGPERRDGFLLITGPPLSGRTTTAWAYVRRLPPGTEVCVPPPGTDLRALPERIAARKSPCVLWLDDLERYVEGLDAALLSRLIAMGVRIVATMTDAAYDEHRFGTPATARVLSRARVVELELEWSEDEFDRIEEAGDPRFEALTDWCGDLRVTEYLAVGPHLWAEWRRAGRPSGNQPGHQLVRAVLDLMRCGMSGAPRELARAVYEMYAPEHTDAFDAALAWAVRPRHGVTGLLVESTEAGGLVGYGYLVGEAIQSDELPPVPYETWDLAVAQGGQLVTHLATVHFRTGAKSGDPEAMYRLARLTDDEEWLRKAADAGHTAAAADLGRALADRGEARAAEHYLEKAADAGDARAATLLGKLLRDRAEGWWSAAARQGDHEAASHLATLLLGRGKVDEAYIRSYQALHTSSAQSSALCGAIHRFWQQEETAQVWFDRAAAAGDDTWSADAFGPAMSISDEEEQLRVECADADADVLGIHVTHVGAFLEKHGRVDEARTWYQKGFELGDAYAAFRLARLREQGGDEDGAAHWMRKAADAGHPGAVKALGGGADTVEG
ncbi:tetratricopeptide repeat protein [Streptomyces thermolilacinus]|uniref:tetratricopeptide repeat protein n=1 Tax=Streptomyces thermolilacinus TaxID=285540 RepID=UPI001112F8B8|nr:sel1 repeat family protein [Streptomyces thermolilacinus]